MEKVKDDKIKKYLKENQDETHKTYILIIDQYGIEKIILTLFHAMKDDKEAVEKIINAIIINNNTPAGSIKYHLMLTNSNNKILYESKEYSLESIQEIVSNIIFKIHNYAINGY